MGSGEGTARVRKFHRKFGEFGRSVLLVGNFGEGKINAFDINSGNFIDPLKKRRGEPLDFKRRQFQPLSTTMGSLDVATTIPMP